MLDLAFAYPEGGYLFYRGEPAAVTVCIRSAAPQDLDVRLTATVADDRGEPAAACERDCLVPASGTCTQTFDFQLDRLGFYRVTVTAVAAGDAVQISTGVGMTTPHERSPLGESVFGVSANNWKPELHVPFFAKLGVRYLRNPGKVTTVLHEDILRQYGMGSTVQLQGKHMLLDSRYAPAPWNGAYHYRRALGDLVVVQEHGNEHWEERDLARLSEWEKSTALACRQADPAGWYANSGEAGVDIHKLQVMYEQGVMDYITCIAVHAYSFPLAPEQPCGYWSVQRLRDLGRWMAERDIRLPVVCTEQGYPAMNGQTRCEAYSPGDLVTLDAQVDYLVRSWLIFLSLGVAKVVWYNGPWLDGFAFMEKDGPAPWPATMALAQLIRMVDGADYVGSWRRDEGVYFLVFRSRADGTLTAAVWRPVYLSRSCEKDCNYTPDGACTEASGLAQETFPYALHHLAPGFTVLDAMGNPVGTDGGVVTIGERPLYICGLSADILPLLEDERVFPVRMVEPRPLPQPVILGINDAKPTKGEYVTSLFCPGETRDYKLRVHNFSDADLHDTLLVETPGELIPSRAELPVALLAGESKEYTIAVRCRALSAAGTYTVRARLASGGAHPVSCRAGVACPLWFNPLTAPPREGSELTIHMRNPSAQPLTVRVEPTHPAWHTVPTDAELTIPAGETGTAHFRLDAAAAEDPLWHVRVTDGAHTAQYDAALPLHYIVCGAAGEPAGPQMRLTDPYGLRLAAESYDGPSLIGNAEPASFEAYARLTMDETYLYAHFLLYDDTVVCVKNTRRNNADSDGVWLQIFDRPDAQKPIRHFCIMPADQAGNPHPSVKEVSQGILFATPYTDYDFSAIDVSSALYADRYTLDVRIRRDSLGVPAEPGGELTLAIRVIDMNHDDWSRLYDTGKMTCKLVDETASTRRR